MLTLALAPLGGADASAAPAYTAGARKAVEPVRALTALRGIAAWWVVVFHFREALPDATPSWVMAPLSAGYLAVDLFFVLSGYVMALNYGAWFTARAFTWATYGRFLWLRLSRIYPLHGTMLLLFLANPVLILLFSHQRDLSGLRWFYYGLSFLLLQDWGLTWGSAWNVPAWSISAEWFAYLLFPALSLCLAAIARTRLAAVAAIAALTGSLALTCVLAMPAGLGSLTQWFTLVRCVAEFAAGICVFHLTQLSPSPLHRRLALAWAACAIAVSAAWHLPDYALVPLSFAATIYALSDERGTLARALRWAPLQWLGAVSYSTYMCHYLLKFWAKFVLVRPGVPPGMAFLCYLAAVLAASAVLHRLVERPGQRAFRRLLWRRAKASA